MPVIVFEIFCLVYWHMLAEAQEIDDYDSCGGLGKIVASDSDW